MNLKEQFVKEYFDKAEIDGLQINNVMFNQRKEKLYTEWLEKRATIHNSEYAAAQKVFNEFITVAHEHDYFSTWIEERINSQK